MNRHVLTGRAMIVTFVVMILMVGPPSLFAQTKTVSGTVTEDTGATLPGVSVLEKGTNNGTVTDSNGKFSISVTTEAVLVFSFIGLKPVEVVVGSQVTIDVIMESDMSTLDEIVVIGYGTAKKSDLTGAVSSVTGDDLRKMPVASVTESLTGRLAGVQVSSTEGSPDATIQIRVRGGGSITQDNTPLFIVDGFPVNNITDISPSDIKSIDVLKDASSTAIYGSRGANGVIIITTKGGNKDGKISVSYNVFGGVKKMAKELDVLAPEDYVNWQYEYALLRADLPSYEDYFGSWQDRDMYNGMKANNWQQQVYGRTGNVLSNDISLRGGNEKVSFSLNYARFNDRAVMVGSDYVRDNVTTKIDARPNDKVDVSFSMRYAQTKVNGSGTNEQNEVSSADSRLKNAIGYPPIPVDGLTSDDTNDQTAGDLVDPLTATADNDRFQLRKNFNLAAAVTWRIIDNLEFRTDIGMDNTNLTDDRFYGLTTYFVKNRPAAIYQNMPAVVLKEGKQVRLRNTNTVSYDFKSLLPGDNHHLKFMVGEEMIKTTSNDLTSEIHGFPVLFTSEEAFKLTTQGKFVQSVDNFFSPDDKLLSFFGRATYDYKGRYLLTATYRADGSSKFLGDNRWGFFPSAAAAWKISEESFMQGTTSWLSNLKLRVSYGESGNNNIPVGKTLMAFESSTTTWINGVGSFWAPSKTMPNPDLKWETTKTKNIGVDFGFLQDRVTGTLELYDNSIEGVLAEFPVQGSGYDFQFRNMCSTRNKGVELSLNYAVIEKADYGLNVTVNFARNKGRVESLGVLPEIRASSGWASTMIGADYLVLPDKPVGLMYGYLSDGRYEVSDFEGYDSNTGRWILKAGVVNGNQIVGGPAPGMMKLKDLNADGLVTVADQKIIGNAAPKHVGGLILNGYAYGFDLTAAFNWTYGNDIYNANKIEFTTMNPNNQYRNLITMQEEGTRWTNLNPSTGGLVTNSDALADMNENTSMWSPAMARYIFSDWAVEDGSFIRLNTLTLGYTVPTAVIGKLHIKSLRLYTTASNVFVWTNYSGFDPEVSTRRKNQLTPGVDYSAYPRSRQLVFGLNLTF